MATEIRPLEIVRFGDSFALDRGAFELRREGRQVRLERIPLDLLLLLVERHGEVVTTGAITSRLFGRGPVPEAEVKIAAAVRQLRTALRDDPYNPRFIHTLSGGGCRFVAALSPGFPEIIRRGPAPRLIPLPRLVAGHIARTRKSRLSWLIAASGALMVAGALGLTLRLTRLQDTPAADQPVRLAVLPITNLTGNAREDALSKGLTQELIAQLGSIEPGRLSVIGGSMLAGDGNSRASFDQQLARTTHAKYVLEGSVRRDGDLVHVTAQLVRADDQVRVWNEQYDHELTSIPAMEAEMAAVITKGVHTTVTGHESSGSAAKVIAHTATTHEATAHAAAPATTPGTAASDLTQQGRLLVGQRTAQGLQAGIQLFQRAIAVNPQYAPAWSALADAYTRTSALGLASPNDVMPKARAAALQALALNPHLAEGHVALGIIAANFDYNREEAQRELQTAIALAPQAAEPHAAYAALLAREGQAAAAIAESARALAVNALSPAIATDHAAVLYLAGHYGEASQSLSRTLALTPSEAGAGVLLASEAQQGQLQQALAQALAWHDAAPSARASATAAYLYGRTGQGAQAEEALGVMEEEVRSEGSDPLPLRALALAGIGDKERLMATLDEAYSEHADFLTTLKVDPAYAALAGDARFEDLKRRVGLD